MTTINAFWLQKISSSLPKFLESLSPREYLHYRAWYKLQVPLDQLKVVADELLKNGLVDPHRHFASIQDRSMGVAYNPKIGFGVWLARSNAQIRKVSAPGHVQTDSCILAIDAYRWNHPDAEKFVKAVLKPLKLKPLVRIGESRIADDKQKNQRDTAYLWGGRTDRLLSSKAFSRYIEIQARI